MTFKAHRRAGHPARLTTQLNRERGADRQLDRVPGIPLVTGSPRLAGSLRQAVALRAAPAGPSEGVARPPGQLASRWTTNEQGKLVIAWSLAPEVEAVPAPWLVVRDLRAIAQAGRTQHVA
jgi:hypothetical protein